jgi:hypothetical protein
MSDVYRLVFRGEVLDGQHPAVVRKRLAQAADFDDGVLDKLFSGRPVVLKHAADTATAARFQALFKKAGARLRVLPVETDDEATEPSDDELQLLPAGADILRDDERSPWQPREIDTHVLALEDARITVAQEPPAAAGPDVSHLTMAEIGVDLGPRHQAPEHPVRAPDLEIAPAGSDLGQQRRSAPPAPPDTSALRLMEPGQS